MEFIHRQVHLISFKIWSISNNTNVLVLCIPGRQTIRWPPKIYSIFISSNFLKFCQFWESRPSPKFLETYWQKSEMFESLNRNFCPDLYRKCYSVFESDDIKKNIPFKPELYTFTRYWFEDHFMRSIAGRNSTLFTFVDVCEVRKCGFFCEKNKIFFRNFS